MVTNRSKVSLTNTEIQKSFAFVASLNVPTWSVAISATNGFTTTASTWRDPRLRSWRPRSGLAPIVNWRKIPVLNFLNGPTLASFSFIFGLFQSNNTFFTTNKCEKCPSSIRRQDTNPRPLEHAWSPITTRPGLPVLNLCLVKYCQLITKWWLTFQFWLAMLKIKLALFLKLCHGLVSLDSFLIGFERFEHKLS